VKRVSESRKWGLHETTGPSHTSTTLQQVSKHTAAALITGRVEGHLTSEKTVICIAMMMCNFLAAGPSIAIVTTTMDFFPGANPGRNPALFASSIAKISYFFTTAALMQGVGNFFWVPIANKYGRRPTYVFSYLIYTVSEPCPCLSRKMKLTMHDRLLPFGCALRGVIPASLLAASSWASALAPLRPSVRPLFQFDASGSPRG